MMFGTDVLLALAFVAAIGFIWVVGKALTNARFVLSPGGWLWTVVLSFSLGAFLVAYLDDNGDLMLVALIPTGLGIVWWLFRLVRRHQARAAAAGV